MPSQKRHVNQLSDDDLLSQLDDDSPDELIETASEDDVINFLNTFDLKKGTNNVECKALYVLYKHWSDNPFSYNSFYKKLKVLLDQHSNPFKLNVSSEDLAISLTPKKYTKKPPSENGNLKKHVESFLRKFSILEGDVWISSDKVYHLYDRWTWQNKYKRPLSITTFINILQTIIKCKKTKNGIFFAVNPEVNSHFISSEGTENEQKTNEKTTNEISSIRSEVESKK